MPSVKKRGGLGRGLNALVSEAEYETGGSAARLRMPHLKQNYLLRISFPTLISREFTLTKLNFVS